MLPSLRIFNTRSVAKRDEEKTIDFFELAVFFVDFCERKRKKNEFMRRF